MTASPLAAAAVTAAVRSILALNCEPLIGPDWNHARVARQRRGGRHRRGYVRMSLAHRNGSGSFRDERLLGRADDRRRRRRCDDTRAADEGDEVPLVADEGLRAGDLERLTAQVQR